MRLFGDYALENWKEYLFPVGAPLAVFVISSIWTNIGWYAVPACAVVMLFMFGLTTLKMYVRWREVELLIAEIKRSQINHINYDETSQDGY